MTSLSTCPYCQAEYRSYETECTEHGKTWKVMRGKCTNCNTTLNEVPSELADLQFERTMRNRQIMREADTRPLRDFVAHYGLGMYPMYEVLDVKGNVHKAFTIEEAEHIGFALFHEGEAFRIIRDGTLVQVVRVPKGMDRYILTVRYIIPNDDKGIDGEEVSFRFGCQNLDVVDHLVKLNQSRGLFFQSWVM